MVCIAPFCHAPSQLLGEDSDDDKPTDAAASVTLIGEAVPARNNMWCCTDAPPSVEPTGSRDSRQLGLMLHCDTVTTVQLEVAGSSKFLSVMLLPRIGCPFLKTNMLFSSS